MTTPTMTEMRGHLMDTLASLRDRDNPMEPDRARAIAQVAGVMVESAKVEVDYLKVTNGTESGFIVPALESVTESETKSLGRGRTLERIGNVTRHKIK